MPDTKITALTAIGANPIIPSTFPIPMVDLTDTSMAASGTTKKVTVNQILGAGGTATLASATITGDLTVDTSTLKVDSANDRVGIGIATPAWPLDIRSATAVAQILSTTGTNAAYLQVSNTGGIFYLGRENSAGTSFASPAYSAVLYAGGAYPLVTTVNGSERYRIASDGVATWSNVGGVAGTAMTLNATGLGVGISSPFADAGYKSIDLRGTTGGEVVLGSSSVREATITADGTNGMILNTVNSTPLRFYTQGGEKMRIDSSGNLGIGVTPSAGGSNYYKTLEIGKAGCGLFTATAVLTGSELTYLSGNGVLAYNAGPEWTYGNNGAAAIYGIEDGVHKWYNATTGTAGVVFTPTQAMTLDASGRLIINSSTFIPPTLNTNGELNFIATSNTNVRFSYRGTDGVTRVANITLA